MIAELAQTRRMDDEPSMDAPSPQLAGKVVIVTGSAGNLGLATAQVLQKVGAKTVLVDRSKTVSCRVLSTRLKIAKPFPTAISQNRSRPKQSRMLSCSSSQMLHVLSTGQPCRSMERAECRLKAVSSGANGKWPIANGRCKLTPVIRLELAVLPVSHKAGGLVLDCAGIAAEIRGPYSRLRELAFVARANDDDLRTEAFQQRWTNQ